MTGIQVELIDGPHGGLRVHVADPLHPPRKLIMGAPQDFPVIRCLSEGEAPGELESWPVESYVLEAPSDESPAWRYRWAGDQS